MAMMHFRPIQCATFRLAKIAEPQKRLVANTYLRYADILSPKQIENLRSYLAKDNRFTRLDQMLEYFAQSKTNAKASRRQRHKEIRKIRRKIEKIRRRNRRSHLQVIMNRIFSNMYPFLLANNVHHLNERRLHLSELLLQFICKWIGYTLPPTRSSKAFYDTFIVNVADNIAIWLDTFVTNSGYQGIGVTSRSSALTAKYDDEEEIGADDDKKKDDADANDADHDDDGDDIENEVFPIQDYIDCSTDDVSSTECSTDGLNDSDDDGEEEGDLDEDDDVVVEEE